MPRGQGHSATATVNKHTIQAARAEAYLHVLFSLPYAGFPRTLTELRRTLLKTGDSVSPYTLQVYKRKFDWLQRLAAMDAAVRERVQNEQIKEVADAERRHAVYGRAMQGRAAERIKITRPEHLDVEDVPRWMESGIKIERAALGLPDQIIELRRSIRNQLVVKVVALFNQAAPLPTVEERRTTFALGLDALLDAWEGTQPEATDGAKHLDT